MGLGRPDVTYNDLHPGIALPNLLHQLGECREDLVDGLVLLPDVIGSQVHGDHVGRVAP